MKPREQLSTPGDRRFLRSDTAAGATGENTQELGLTKRPNPGPPKGAGRSPAIGAMPTRTTARCHFTPARTGHRRGTDPAGGDARGTAAPHGRCRAPSGPLPGPTPRGPKPRPRGNLPRAPTAAPLTEPRCPPTGNETGGHGTGPGAAPLSPPAACRDTGDVLPARRAREARHASALLPTPLLRGAAGTRGGALSQGRGPPAGRVGLWGAVPAGPLHVHRYPFLLPRGAGGHVAGWSPPTADRTARGRSPTVHPHVARLTSWDTQAWGSLMPRRRPHSARPPCSGPLPSFLRPSSPLLTG